LKSALLNKQEGELWDDHFEFVEVKRELPQERTGDVAKVPAFNILH